MHGDKEPPTGLGNTLVIMPAWNESAVIGDTVREVLACVPGVDVLVVDDGSTDDTDHLAREAGAAVLTLPYNMGVGAALRTGYKYAWRNGYSQAIQVDADGQHNPRDIPKVLAGLADADISIGARFAGEGDYGARGPRRWAMAVLAAALSAASGTKLTDVTSGFRAANRRTIGQYTRHYPAEYLGDTVDSLMTAVRMGHTVTQIPVAMRPRQGGTPSASPYKAMIYLFRSLFALLIASTRRRRGTVQPA